MLVQDIMTPTTRFIARSASLSDAADIMEAEGIGFLPVRDGGQLVGVVTDRDMALRAPRAASNLGTLAIDDVMSPHAHAIRATTPVAGAAAAMKLKGVRRLLVLDDQSHLVGVLSVGDLARKSAPQTLAASVLKHLASRRRPAGARA